ncbi:sugar ABC transporter ATP-binding protein [Mesorhizobium sp. L-8-3]|nr:sugar ABC transporter ATP-binding protein [Mesorhizobium sp. L-8-3]
MAPVSICNARKSFGAVNVLRGVDVEVADGEFVALVGPSGCGKSTLLRIIAGLEGLTDGDIVIGDRVVSDVAPRERDVAMVFQNYALYPHMTVARNMGFSLKLAGRPAAEIERRVAAAAEILGLQALLQRLPKQLSGGQRQRVAMGRAIVRDPKVFLFDEPLSNLDAKLRVQMRVEIKALHQRLKTTTVYVTHDQIEAMTMADKIVVMRDGIIEQVGSPLDLYDRPANMFVAGFIGSPAMNFVTGALRDGRFMADGGPIFTAEDMQAFGDREVVLGVRPEHFDIHPDGAEVEVVVVEQTGSEMLIVTRLGEATLNCLVRERLRLKSGDRIRLMPRAGHLHYFDPATGQRLGYDEPVTGRGSFSSASSVPSASGHSPSSKAAAGHWMTSIRSMISGRNSYRPEMYYMRGPGPKTRSKRLLDDPAG